MNILENALKAFKQIEQQKQGRIPIEDKIDELLQEYAKLNTAILEYQNKLQYVLNYYIHTHEK